MTAVGSVLLCEVGRYLQPTETGREKGPGLLICPQGLGRRGKGGTLDPPRCQSMSGLGSAVAFLYWMQAVGNHSREMHVDSLVRVCLHRSKVIHRAQQCSCEDVFEATPGFAQVWSLNILNI